MSIRLFWYKFNSEEGYESLINNTEVRTANIIFIDSKLFENRNTNGKFTGEEFKIILKTFTIYWGYSNNTKWSRRRIWNNS